MRKLLAVNKNSHELAIVHTMDFVEANCEKQLTLEGLAERADMSPFHFHRLFRAYAGQPLGKFIRHVRLQKGARLLRTSDSKIVMIAFDCGYGSHEAFSRTFQVWAGVSPTQYRDSLSQGQPVILPNTEPFERSNSSVEGPTLQRLAETWFVFKRHIGPYSQIPQAFDATMQALARDNSLPNDPVIAGIAYDDPDLRPSSQLRFDAGIVVDHEREAPDGLRVTRIAPCQCAVVRVTGPYEQLVDGYDKLYRHGARLIDKPIFDAPAILFYREMPPMVSIDDAQTEIWLPLTSRSA